MKPERGNDHVCEQLISNVFLQSNNVTKIYGEAAPAVETKRRKIAHKETFREQLEKEVEELGVRFRLVKHCRFRFGPHHQEHFQKSDFLTHTYCTHMAGASTLTGKEKKEYEAKKIMRLGGKAPPRLKTPIKILTGMKKKGKERELKKREEVWGDAVFGGKYSSACMFMYYICTVYMYTLN